MGHDIACGANDVADIVNARSVGAPGIDLLATLKERQVMPAGEDGREKKWTSLGVSRS